MFAGIIHQLGTVDSLSPSTDGGMCLVIDAPDYQAKIELGSSHAINGVCLTLLDNSLPLRFDLSAETREKTTFKELKEGDRVNIEPGLRLGDSIDGHLVSGHVDGVGTVISVTQGERFMGMIIEFPALLNKYIALKGSVCIDGASLTVNSVSNNQLSVAVIPHTLENTRMGNYQRMTQVNIEVDLIARYLERLTNH